MTFIEKTEEELAKMTAKERREYQTELRAFKSKQSFEIAEEEGAGERDFPSNNTSAVLAKEEKEQNKNRSSAKPKAEKKATPVKRGRKKQKIGEYRFLHINVSLDTYNKLVELAEEKSGGNLTRYVNDIITEHINK